jgi:hypothetical protein
MLFYFNRANITKTNQLLKIQFILLRRALYCPRWPALFNPVQYITRWLRMSLYPYRNPNRATVFLERRSEDSVFGVQKS